MADEQFNPEALKAQYLADQHGIDRDSYLKEGLSDNEFIAQYGDKPIEAPVEAQTFEPSTEEDAKAGYMNPVLGAGVGALAGVKAAPYVGELNAAKYVLDKLDTLGQNKGASARQPAPASQLFDVPNNLPSTEFASPELTVSEARYSNPHGYGEPAVKSANINQDISTVHANARGMGTMGNEAPLAEGFSREANNRIYTPHGSDINPSPAQLTAMRQLEMDKMRQAQAQKTAQAQASEAAKQEAVRAFRAKEGASRALNAPPEASKGSPTVRQRLGNVMQPSGFGGKLLTTALTPAAGAAAGYLGTDAFNRYAEGDKTQAAISGTGALSSLAALHPQLRGKAAGLAVLAPIVNYLIDKSTGHHPGEPRAPQSGGVTYSEPEHHAAGGKILKGVSPNLTAYDWLRGLPKQFVSGDYLNYLQKEGMKSGGLASVKKFDGGGEVEATLPPVNVSARRPSRAEIDQYNAENPISSALNTGYERLKHGQGMLTGEPIGKSLDEQFSDPMNAMNFLPAGGAENALAGVVKNVGGNWLPKGIDPIINTASRGEFSAPVRNWYNSVLGKYVKNRMGSPEDEIRKLADQGITHAELPGTDARMENFITSARKRAGFPEAGSATSPKGKSWEDLVDSTIDSPHASVFHSDPNFVEANPWISKLDPDTPMYYVNDHLNTHPLGFHNIGNMLESDIASGKLTPEQLAQMSVEKAVRRTHGYNQAQNTVAQAASEALPTVKEYPTGFHWKELTHQDPETLKSILKKEGDTMQNCIGGYCENVLEDGTKLYSLRDAAGNPHANVEVRQHRDGSPMINQIKGKQNAAPSGEYQPYVQDFVQNPVGNKDFSVVGDLENTGLIDVAKLKQHGLTGGSPRFDKAHSAELSRIFPTEVGPYGGVQMSGPHGTSLPEYYKMKQLVQDIPHKFVSPQQLTEHLQGFETRPIEQSYSKYYAPEGMALGGKVGAIKSLIDAAPQLYQGAKDLILPPAENAARTQIIGTLPT